MRAAPALALALALLSVPGAAHAAGSDEGDPDVDPLDACEAAPYPGGADPASWLVRLLSDVAMAFCKPSP